MLTVDQLKSICKTADGRAACVQYVDALNRFMPQFGIDSLAREAAFVAQIAHESQDFTRVTENLNYSADGLANTWASRYAEKGANGKPVTVVVNGRNRNKPNALALRLNRSPEAIANNVYANRMGNGDEASGDGWRNRGRGLKQLTGHDNYAACGADLGINLLANPDLLLTPEYAVKSACWFWKVNKLSPYADRSDIQAITKIINGGDNGLAERQAYYTVALASLAKVGA